MARRRRGAATSSEKRHSRIINPVDRSHFVYSKCWICGAEVVVNGLKGENLKSKRLWLKRGPFYLCLRCKFSKFDFGRRFVQMFLLLKRVSKIACTDTGPLPRDPEMCKCPAHTALRLTHDIEADRPLVPQMMYRKKSK